ncbi:hypothetical protein [Streptomyces sp. NPDC004135]
MTFFDFCAVIHGNRDLRDARAERQTTVSSGTPSSTHAHPDSHSTSDLAFCRRHVGRQPGRAPGRDRLRPHLGSSTFYSVNGYYYSYTVNSGGGDFKICVTTGSGSDHLYGLFEYDPDDEGLNSDEKIGSSKPLSNGDCATWSVGAYVDGSNNRAEIYVATQDSKVQSVK